MMNEAEIANQLKDLSTSVRVMEKTVNAIDSRTQYEHLANKAEIKAICEAVHVIRNDVQELSKIVREGIRDRVRELEMAMKDFHNWKVGCDQRLDEIGEGKQRVKLEHTKGLWALIAAIVATAGVALAALIT